MFEITVIFKSYTIKLVNTGVDNALVEKPEFFVRGFKRTRIWRNLFQLIGRHTFLKKADKNAFINCIPHFQKHTR